MTGFDHSTAALMVLCGIVAQGVECIHNIRSRYDGVGLKPWDEAECGHHYPQAMAAWSNVVAVSGLPYEVPSEPWWWFRGSPIVDLRVSGQPVRAEERSRTRAGRHAAVPFGQSFGGWVFARPFARTPKDKQALWIDARGDASCA